MNAKLSPHRAKAIKFPLRANFVFLDALSDDRIQFKPVLPIGHPIRAVPNDRKSRKLLGVLLGLSLFHYGCAVTGPRVTRQEEEVARGQIKQADYRIWWGHQKRLFRVSDRFAWGVDTPGAPYRNAIGILPVLRKSASSYELALYDALGNPRDGTVLHVSAGSPGEKAGIEDGDILVAIDDRNISAMSLADLAVHATKGQTRRFSFIKRSGGDVRTVSITPSRKLDITFVADRSQDINAYATKYGDTHLVNINYGIFNLIQNDDELAIFVGHEVVHILKRHQDQSAAIHAVGGLVQLGVAIVGVARGVDTTSIRKGISTVTDIVDTRYTREQEREADYLGMYVAHQAGFNVQVAPIVWEKFAVATPESMNDSFMSNHPAHPERFVRIQKTTEEIRQGLTLQEVWSGDFSETRLASNNSQRPITPPVTAGSVATSTYSPTNTPGPSSPTPLIRPSTTVASLTSSSFVTASSSPEQTPITKTYASLVQYDGPRIKSGVTLDAQFMDDGSGSGEALVNDVGNRMLRGTFTTITPGSSDWPRPKILDRATLNKLQILNDRPWVTATVSNADTVLECVFGETQPLGLKKGACRDNYGNRYHLSLVP